MFQARRCQKAELAVLEVIWASGEPTSRDIADAVYEKVSDSKMASVQKLLERLEAKGYVRRNAAGAGPLARASIGKEALSAARCDPRPTGSAAEHVPLVTTLLRSKFSKKNRQQLRELIEELWPEKK